MFGAGFLFALGIFAAVAFISLLPVIIPIGAVLLIIAIAIVALLLFGKEIFQIAAIVVFVVVLSSVLGVIKRKVLAKYPKSGLFLHKFLRIFCWSLVGLYSLLLVVVLILKSFNRL